MSSLIRLVCVTCDEGFARYRSQIKKGRAFCSVECRRTPEGTREPDDRGYVNVVSRQHPKARQRRVREHVLVAEKALGRPLPRKAKIHHVDGDRARNEGGNLVVCEDQAYHSLLHYRQRIKARGGDFRTEKICCRCNNLTPLTGFHRAKRARDGLQGICKVCAYLSNIKEAVNG